MFQQKTPGRFEIPEWDEESLAKLRDALKRLGSAVPDNRRTFGGVHEVDQTRHLIGTAGGFGGLPEHAVIYNGVAVAMNDGVTPFN